MIMVMFGWFCKIFVGNLGVFGFLIIFLIVLVLFLLNVLSNKCLFFMMEVKFIEKVCLGILFLLVKNCVLVLIVDLVKLIMCVVIL